MEDMQVDSKITTSLRKIRYSVNSMKKQMKITENEKIYRLENFQSNNIKEEYIKCFKCTKCDKSFQSVLDKGKEVGVHPLLEVLMCFSCCDYYGDGNFSMGSDDEDKYCRWCGEGGTIFSCSKCICGFCNKCIKKHFGKETLKKIEKDDEWKCYFCDPTPLWFLRAICSLAKEISETKKEQIKRKRDYKSLTRKRSKIKINEECSPSSPSFNIENEKMDLNAADSDNESATKEKKKSDLVNFYNPSQETLDVELKENKNQIVFKLKGIWKIIQLLMEIGLKTSGERLNILTELSSVDTITDCQKEYTKLRIILNTLRSFLDKTTDPIDSLKYDLNFKNSTDEKDEVFMQDEEFKKNFQEKIEVELKKINSVDIVRPILKVKSFAKMTSDNLLNPKKNNYLIKTRKSEFSDKNNTEMKTKQANVDEYNEETDESSGEILVTKKQSNTSSESEFSAEGEQYMIVKKSKKKLREKFENFKQKRKDFIKKRKELKTNKKDMSKSDYKELISLDSSDDNFCTKNKKYKSTKSKIIESSNEEKEEIKAGKKVSKIFTRSQKKKKRKEESSNYEESELESESESALESDSSKSTTWSTSKLNFRNKKNLRNLKENLNDSSNSDSEEIEKVNKRSRGKRRNIRKILNKECLQLDTKDAVKYEEEKKKRLQLKKKKFEEYFSGGSKETETDNQLILDFDEETKEPLVTVDKKLVKKLKPHQMKGVQFMWDNCFESVNRLKNDTGTGCILAHCMGFGKTLQVITLIHTVMSHNLGVNTVLIISPFGIISNWVNEFDMWLKDVDAEFITVYEFLKIKNNKDRVFEIEQWKNDGGVMILSYDLFRNLTKPYNNSKKNMFRLFEKALLNPGPDLVICDEGHLLKNAGSTLFKCINRIKTARRIVLTGTPLQNNLLEYYCMMQFVKPNFLGSKKEFSNRFINPIINGQFEDSTEEDVKLMKQRSYVLHSMLKGCIQRFGFSILASYLPEKKEFVLLISLTNAQINAYNYFVSTLSGKIAKSSKVTTLFNDFHYLQRIWTHPRALLIDRNKDSDKNSEQSDSEASLKDFIVHTDEEESTVSGNNEKESSVEEIGSSKKKFLNANNLKFGQDAEKEISSKNGNEYWWDEFFQKTDFEDIHSSNKLLVLFSLLDQCSKAGEKVLVFSQSLNSLDIIEYFLNKTDENSGRNNTSVGNFQDSWLLGIDYFRLDGSTSSETRFAWCKSFNLSSNKRARLFLISTKAGGLGINLSGANRVIIFDASWNPSNDLQSIFRVYRFGQKKKCYIYRFLAEGTMEEKIYKRQITKLALAERVIDEHQIERHYSMGNLQELYSYEPTPQEKRKTHNLPKDNLLAETLSMYKDAIIAYHEQDSLLENKEEEELSEEDKKIAWQNYHEEKLITNISNINFSQMLGNSSLTHKPNFAESYVPVTYINPFTERFALSINNTHQEVHSGFVTQQEHSSIYKG